MSTPVRYDEQYCPIARGLDVLGDRWTLLIVRELGAGPQRFSDLQRHLPGIAATVLSERLRTMTEAGLVETVPGPPPSARHRYALGPAGRRALPVLGALVRFGMPLLEPPPADDAVRPMLAVRGALLAYHDPVAAVGVSERYELHVDGEAFTVDSNGGAPTDEAEPDLVVTVPARAIIDVRQRRAEFADLVAEGTVRCDGSAAALAHFTAIYRLGGKVLDPVAGR